MSYGAMVRESTGNLGSLSASVLSLPMLLLLLTAVSTTQASVCRPPLEPENGGYSCHPSPCRSLGDGTVIEYFCDEGYVMKGDYRYLTCTNGEWNTLTQVRCLPTQEKDPEPVFGMNTWSLVVTTASCVLLILLLVVLFVLLQPKLKSFHHSRRDEDVSGQPVSIMVDGVQVSLPTYEEAVAGCSGAPSGLPPLTAEEQSAEGSQSQLQSQPPPPPLPQLALSSQTQTRAQGQAPGHGHGQQHAELAMVHRGPSPSSPSSSSSSSASLSSASWGPLLGATAAVAAATAPHRGERLSSTHSEQLDFSDDIPLLKEA